MRNREWLGIVLLATSLYALLRASVDQQFGVGLTIAVENTIGIPHFLSALIVTIVIISSIATGLWFLLVRK